MTEGSMSSNSPIALEMTSENAKAARPRIWVPVIAMAVYWAFTIISDLIEMPMFPRFMSQMGAGILVGLIILIWWMINRRVRWGDKLIVLAAVVASPIVAKALSDESVGPFPIMLGFP